MADTDQLLRSCFNLILENKIPEAETAFREAYRNHPGEISFLYGTLLALMIRKKSCLELLEQEKQVAKNRDRVLHILHFFRNNSTLSDQPVHSQLYNLGMYLRKNFDDREAAIFLQAGDILKPSDIKNITARGEMAVLSGDYAQGINLFVRAAGLFKEQSEGIRK